MIDRITPDTTKADPKKADPTRTGAQALDIDLSRMAGVVETQLADVVVALERRDLAAAARVMEADARVDEAQATIERKAIEALSEQRAVRARADERRVREIVMSMKVSGELERVGDLAKNVAKRMHVIAQESDARISFGLINMGRAALRQLTDVLNAFEAKNVEAAVAVWGGDDDLDELYNSVFRETLLAMMDDPTRINACTHMTFIAKNFERVGDHATNIAEALHYFVTGAPLAIDRPKGDETSTTAVAAPSPG
ncbi:MAG: phosphate signaling complex protein PhoU [Pseudomonadota bacterium]